MNFVFYESYVLTVFTDIENTLVFSGIIQYIKSDYRGDWSNKNPIIWVKRRNRE